MYREIRIDLENKKEKDRLRKIGGIILWGLLIGVSMVLASRSLIMAG